MFFSVPKQFEFSFYSQIRQKSLETKPCALLMMLILNNSLLIFYMVISMLIYNFWTFFFATNVKHLFNVESIKSFSGNFFTNFMFILLVVIIICISAYRLSRLSMFCMPPWSKEVEKILIVLLVENKKQRRYRTKFANLLTIICVGFN